jgi:hypothetical protein
MVQSSLDLKLISCNSRILVMLKQIEHINLSKDLIDDEKNIQINDLQNQINEIAIEIDKVKSDLILNLSKSEAKQFLS